MRLEIWSEKVERPTYLRLAKTEDGSVELRVVYADGRLCGASVLLAITPDGCLERYKGVWSKLGFKLDERGRVRLIEEDR